MRFVVSFIFAISFALCAQAHDLYRLQTGDTVEIWVEQDPNLRRQVIVAPDGRIALPQAGHLRAEGLTPEELERSLARRLAKNFATEVDVTVIVVNTPVPGNETRIFLTGEIGTPGQIIVTEPTTVLQAISIAGGLGTFAAKKRIHVRRNVRGREVLIPFNYRNVETGRSVADNVYLRDGDVIVVPERRLFE